MNRLFNTYHFVFVFMMMLLLSGEVYAQDVQTTIPKAQQHREAIPDSLGHRTAMTDSLQEAALNARIDSVIKDSSDMLRIHEGDTKVEGQSVKVTKWIPDSKRALWLAIAFPGGGQIYNRKFWKLPIIYGGFMGCIYALNWNDNMYRDYSQAYIDIMDSDPNTKSYMNFIPSTYDVDANIDRLKEVFKRKKDYFRRYRDLSIFCIIGVYALSIIDAYVDAELSSFEINDDLSMKIHPTIMNDSHRYIAGSGINGSSYGIGCSLNF